MEEHLCQIYIPASAGITPARAFYPTNLSGDYKAKIVGVSWNDITTAADHRLIKIQSECFRNPYGSFGNTLLFGNKSDHNQTYSGDYPIDLSVQSGRIDIELIPSTVYNNTGNNTFIFCILSLLVRKI